MSTSPIDPHGIHGIPGIAELALIEISFAATVFPKAWPIVELVYTNQCDPIEIIDAGTQWFEIFDHLETARGGLFSKITTMSGDAWSSGERAAFHTEMRNYAAQLMTDQGAAIGVGAAMVSTGVLLLILILTYSLVATVLALAALFVEGCLLTGYGVAVAEAVEDAANLFAAEALDVLESINDMVESVSNGGAKVIAAALAGDAGVQLRTGNPDAVKNLVQTVVYGSLDTGAGLVSAREQNMIAGGLGGKGSFGRTMSIFLGVEETQSGQKVDSLGDWAVGRDLWEGARNR